MNMSAILQSRFDSAREDRILKALSSFRDEIIEEITTLKQLLLTSFVHSSLEQTTSESPVHAHAVNLLNDLFRTKMQEFMSVASSSTGTSLHDSNFELTEKEDSDCDELNTSQVSTSDNEPTSQICESHVNSSNPEKFNYVPEVDCIKSETSEILEVPLQSSTSHTSMLETLHQQSEHNSNPSNTDLFNWPIPNHSGSLQDFSLLDCNSKQSFSCNECGKVFTYKSGLQKHLRVHTGSRPYVCKLCGKSFAQKGSLKYHINIHTGEKPFKCSICGKSFIHRGNLNYHVRKHKH